ncbi:hypothetical protein MSG28_013663 [Choristoneura fumiferana]|uniref:Uncharacterized protein n=1 Tax=Choristoneura fumiferana TaxID=7141 RepID=A0ACC0K8V2_CHOFU|nr:hypothetical protein MSG28_013663 [Choristoneura fumiferana]
MPRNGPKSAICRSCERAGLPLPNGHLFSPLYALPIALHELIRFHWLTEGVAREFAESLFAFVPEYHVDAMLELCNTLRLYMHPTVPVQQIPAGEAVEAGEARDAREVKEDSEAVDDAKSESSKVAEDEVALRIHSSNSAAYTPRASPHQVVDAQNQETKKMSRKAFLMSLARLVIVELGSTLRLSYVVVAELLPRLRGSLGIKNRGINVDQHATEFFNKAREENFNNLSATFLAQPQPRLCTILDLLWTFLDEAALCDVLEHCIVRECLLFDLVSPNMQFAQQMEGVYVLCGLMQHRETRHHLVKYVFFNKISFDNFLNVKCPDDAVLRTIIRSPWWQRPTSVHGETDPRIAGTMSHELPNDNIHTLIVIIVINWKTSTAEQKPLLPERQNEQLATCILRLSATLTMSSVCVVEGLPTLQMAEKGTITRTPLTPTGVGETTIPNATHRAIVGMPGPDWIVTSDDR